MTREDALKMAKAKLECMVRRTNPFEWEDCNNNCEECHFNYEQGNMGEQKEWLKMLINVLEQEPCEDAVSRKAVLNLARDLEFSKVKGMENYKHRCIEVEDVEELPSIMPDLSSLREINEALTKRVQYLENMERYATPVTPTRKKGKWLKSNIGGAKVCSICQTHMGLSNFKFCPNCGAEMESEE